MRRAALRGQLPTLVTLSHFVYDLAGAALPSNGDLIGPAAVGMVFLTETEIGSVPSEIAWRTCTCTGAATT